MSIQQSVLSMMGSLNSIQETANENKRKAINIALGAVSGGMAGGPAGAIAGGAKAAAKEAGIRVPTGGGSDNSGSKSIPVTDYTVSDAGQSQQLLQPTSPQMIAMQRAAMNLQNQRDVQVAQRDVIANFGKSDAFLNSEFNVFGKKVKARDLPPKMREGIEKSMSDKDKYAAIEREKKNGKA